MDAACTIQDSIHVFSLVRKYVSRILGTYQPEKAASGVFIRVAGNTQGMFLVVFCFHRQKTSTYRN